MAKPRHHWLDIGNPLCVEPPVAVLECRVYSRLDVARGVLEQFLLLASYYVDGYSLHDAPTRRQGCRDGCRISYISMVTRLPFGYISSLTGFVEVHRYQFNITSANHKCNRPQLTIQQNRARKITRTARICGHDTACECKPTKRASLSQR